MERGNIWPGARRRRRRIWEPIGEAQFLCTYWLNRAETRISSHFTRELKGWGLIPSEWAAMREMYRPGRASSLSLAAAIGMTKGGASKVIDRLVRKGLASRSIGKLDRRCRPVRLTRVGKNIVVLLAILADRHDSEFFHKPNLRHHLMRALKRVVIHARQKDIARGKTAAFATPPLNDFYHPGGYSPY
jgi:DNA-binding MarR family transcriptional regulator